jgi:hypothetical protein
MAKILVTRASAPEPGIALHLLPSFPLLQNPESLTDPQITQADNPAINETVSPGAGMVLVRGTQLNSAMG